MHGAQRPLPTGRLHGTAHGGTALREAMVRAPGCAHAAAAASPQTIAPRRKPSRLAANHRASPTRTCRLLRAAAHRSDRRRHHWRRREPRHAKEQIAVVEWRLGRAREAVRTARDRLGDHRADAARRRVREQLREHREQRLLPPPHKDQVDAMRAWQLTREQRRRVDARASSGLVPAAVAIRPLRRA
eukprot:5818855-Prymnesium_polylepis.1